MRSRIASRSRDDVGSSRAARSAVPQIESLETRQFLSGGPIAPPVAPTNLTATADGRAPVIRLTWTDNSGKESGYVVYRKYGRNHSWVIAATLSANSTYFRDARLAAATGYAYEVAAFNRGGYSALTPPVVATTVAAGMPVIDGTFGSGGNAVDATRSNADRLAISPGGNTLYALSIAAFNTTSSASHIVVDAFTSTGSPATAFASGQLDLNAALPTALVNARGLAVQADGKVLVAGDTTLNPSVIAVARFNTDGTLDTSFAGGAGELVTNLGDQEDVCGIAVAADGSIYLAGDDGNNSRMHQQFFATRLHSDGTVDRTYGNNGVVQGDLQPDPSILGLANEIGYRLDATAMTLDPSDGSVIVVGGTALLDGNGVPSSAAGLGARLLSDGTVTDEFSYADSSGLGAGPRAVIVDAQHRIVVAGIANSAAKVIRLNADGTPDATWVGPGTIVTPGGASPNSAELDGVAQLADGSYVVVGGMNVGNAVIARLSATDGKVVAGWVVNRAPATDTFPASYDAVAVAPDGSIFAAGEGANELLVSKYRVL